MATRSNIYLKVPKYVNSTTQAARPGSGIKLIIGGGGGGMKRLASHTTTQTPADFHLLHSIVGLEPSLMRDILELSYPERETDDEQFTAFSKWITVYPDRPIYTRVVHWICAQMTRLPYTTHTNFTDLTMSLFPVLRQLCIDKFPAVTPAVLLGMTNLMHLEIRDDARIRDDFIGLLTQLTSLDLTGNNTITSGGLRPLTNLRRLCLDDQAGVTDFDGPRLRHLSLVDNRAFYGEALVRLTGLHSLDLSHNRVFTDHAISSLTTLQILYLNSNRVISADGLRTLTGLTELNLTRDSVVTDDGLAPLTNLRSLNLSHNPMISDAGLATLVNLEHLTLRHNDLITPDGLRPLTALRDLNISMNDRMPIATVMALIPANCLVRGVSL